LIIGHQQTVRAAALEHCGELPSEVESVLDGHIHSLSGIRTVSVTRVAGDEHPWSARLPLLGRHIVESLRDPQADLVDGPPCDLLDVEPIRTDDPLCCFDDGIDGESAPYLWGGRID